MRTSIFARTFAVIVALAISGSSALAQTGICETLPTQDFNRFALMPEPDRSDRAQIVVEACKALASPSQEQSFALATALVRTGQSDAARPILDQIASDHRVGAMRLLAHVLASGASNPSPKVRVRRTTSGAMRGPASRRVASSGRR